MAMLPTLERAGEAEKGFRRCRAGGAYPRKGSFCARLPFVEAGLGAILDFAGLPLRRGFLITGALAAGLVLAAAVVVPVRKGALSAGPVALGKSILPGGVEGATLAALVRLLEHTMEWMNARG